MTLLLIFLKQREKLTVYTVTRTLKIKYHIIDWYAEFERVLAKLSKLQEGKTAISLLS